MTGGTAELEKAGRAQACLHPLTHLTFLTLSPISPSSPAFGTHFEASPGVYYLTHYYGRKQSDIDGGQGPDAGLHAQAVV